MYKNRSTIRMVKKIQIGVIILQLYAFINLFMEIVLGLNQNTNQAEFYINDL